MRWIVPIFLCLALPLMQGCFAAAAPLASPAVEGLSSLTGTAGSTTTGYFQSQSQIDLNKANIEQIEAQAQLTQAQAEALRSKQDQLDSERRGGRRSGLRDEVHSHTAESRRPEGHRGHRRLNTRRGCIEWPRFIDLEIYSTQYYICA